MWRDPGGVPGNRRLGRAGGRGGRRAAREGGRPGPGPGGRVGGAPATPKTPNPLKKRGGGGVEIERHFETCRSIVHQEKETGEES